MSHCPTLFDWDEDFSTDYYAQVGSQTCDTIEQCKRRDKAGSAEFGNEFVTVYHDFYEIHEEYLDETARNAEWTEWFELIDMGGETDARNPNGYAATDISEWFAYTGFKSIDGYASKKYFLRLIVNLFLRSRHIQTMCRGLFCYDGGRDDISRLLDRYIHRR